MSHVLSLNYATERKWQQQKNEIVRRVGGKTTPNKVAAHQFYTWLLEGLGLTTNLLLPYKWDLRWSHIIPLPSTPTCLKLQTLDVCSRAAPLSSMSSHRRRREPAHLFANTRPDPEEDICPRGAPQVGVTRSLAPLQGAEISDDLPKQECSGGPCHLCFCCAFQ